MRDQWEGCWCWWCLAVLGLVLVLVLVLADARVLLSTSVRRTN